MLTIQRGDTGIQFIGKIENEEDGSTVDMSSANNIKFIFKAPNSLAYSVDGSLYTNGKDGKVQYTSQPTDLLTVGIWKFQVSYALSGSSKVTSWVSFQVIPNLQDLK